jgi:hypothetical protein
MRWVEICSPKRSVAQAPRPPKVVAQPWANTGERYTGWRRIVSKMASSMDKNRPYKRPVFAPVGKRAPNLGGPFGGTWPIDGSGVGRIFAIRTAFNVASLLPPVGHATLPTWRRRNHS